MRRIRIYKKKKRKINIERLHLEELRVTRQILFNFYLIYFNDNEYENKFDLKNYRFQNSDPRDFQFGPLQ